MEDELVSLMPELLRSFPSLTESKIKVAKKAVTFGRFLTYRRSTGLLSQAGGDAGSPEAEGPSPHLQPLGPNSTV